MSGAQDFQATAEGGRPPRLGFVLAALNTGGAERHAVALRQRLRARGYGTFLLAIARARSSTLSGAPGAEDAVSLDTARVLTSPVAWFGAWRALRRLNADVIFTVNPACAVVVTALRRLGLLRGRVVCIFHSSRLQRREGLSFAPFRWVAPSLDALVYISEPQRALWSAQRLKAKRTAVIVNGVDFEGFSAAAFDPAAERAKLGLSQTDYVIGIVAALRPEKRHRDLIAAVAALRAAGAPAKLLVVGDGAMRQALTEQVGDLGLSDQVLFAGDQGDVRPFVVACDVCALCSDIETFSLAALEILALGTPLVSSDVGAMGQIVQSGVNGLLYPVGSVEQLTAQLARLADPAVRGPMRSAARPSVQGFEVGRMVDAYEALAKSLFIAP